MTTPPLDETDKQILRAPQHEGRVSYAELGPEVGLSAPATRTRVETFTYFGTHTYRCAWDVP